MDSVTDMNKTSATSATDQDLSASYDSKKLSLIDRKFLKGEAFVPPSDRDNFVGFRPHYIFLYGTLMDPMQLRKVLQLENTPTFQPATIVGWKIMLWGHYPALVFNPGNVIHGMAYEVQKELHIEYLKYYETEVYKIKGCTIKFNNGTEVPGKTFIYNGDKSLLKEGSFDLKDWQMKQLEKKSF
ncbi:hypothetical protein BP6252_12640 [Coleophoma cylindrospora]|uniref:Putative gamma-glutamylcyclotransferase n=1 Tax=Coleophoma cylindrospora TaxID=1849047 RepID=A0A3D8QCH8_9HELO|nr:hypothetical protein BP6252_12640 [Coleophoma cylindrospora]